MPGVEPLVALGDVVGLNMKFVLSHYARVNSIEQYMVQHTPKASGESTCHIESHRSARWPHRAKLPALLPFADFLRLRAACKQYARHWAFDELLKVRFPKEMLQTARGCLSVFDLEERFPSPEKKMGTQSQ
eukprot:s6044_g5.t1